MACDVIEKRSEYLANPTPGDYWNEMMVPIAIVLAVNARGVLVITETLDKGKGWMWDFDKARTVSRDEFAEIVRYGFCYHKFHEKAVGWWKEHLGIQ